MFKTILFTVELQSMPPFEGTEPVPGLAASQILRLLLKFSLKEYLSFLKLNDVVKILDMSISKAIFYPFSRANDHFKAAGQSTIWGGYTVHYLAGILERIPVLNYLLTLRTAG